MIVYININIRIERFTGKPVCALEQVVYKSADRRLVGNVFRLASNRFRKRQRYIPQKCYKSRNDAGFRDQVSVSRLNSNFCQICRPDLHGPVAIQDFEC